MSVVSRTASCVQLSRVTYILSKLKVVLTDKLLLLVYHAMFHCHLNYGVKLWEQAAICYEILKIQKKAL